MSLTVPTCRVCREPIVFIPVLGWCHQLTFHEHRAVPR